MKHLVLIQFKMLRNRLRSLTLLDEFKAALFLLIGCLFLGGIYLGTWRLMYYLNHVAVVGPLLINKLLSLVFLTSFSMVIFSSLITSFTTLYSSRDLAWLMATPLSIRHLFAFKSLNTAFYASWMVLVALIPFLAAFAQVKNAAFSFYGGALVMLVPFLVLGSLVGIVASLLLMRFFPSHRTRDFLLISGVFVVTGLYILFRFMQPERLVKPDGMEIVAQYLSYLNAPTAVYLPSWWVTAGICGLMPGDRMNTLFYMLLLWGSALAVSLLVIGLAEQIFYRGWAEGQVYHRRTKAVTHRFYFRHSRQALLEKDIAVFFRDATQWSQLLLLGALVVVYLFSIFKLPLETMYLQNLISFFNVGLIGFILAAVALRFVFPSISLEASSLWLLRSSPLSLRELLREKLLFGSIPVVGMGVILVIVSNLIMKVDMPVFIMTVAAVMVMTVGLSALAVGFGAIFPIFNYTSVAQIESSAGGLFFAVTAFFYLGLNMSFWALPLQNFYRYKFGGTHLPWNSFWWAAAGLAVINIVAVAVPLTAGLKSLEEFEQ